KLSLRPEPHKERVGFDRLLGKPKRPQPHLIGRHTFFEAKLRSIADRNGVAATFLLEAIGLLQFSELPTDPTRSQPGLAIRDPPNAIAHCPSYAVEDLARRVQMDAADELDVALSRWRRHSHFTAFC